MQRRLLGFLLVSCLCACHRAEAPAKRAFYYWRTTFALSKAERSTLESQRVGRLYVRLFDVAWDRASNAPIPVGRMVFQDALPAGLEIVPVVYLASSVFEHDSDPSALATRVWESALATGFSFREIQSDCDWSDATREAYFAFCRTLRALAKSHGATLSATIRLHQVKYSARTGIPPADRGMLMFYNMGSLSAEPARISIFNREDAARYTAEIDRYTLPLDAALPVFSWAIHGRGGQIVGLIDKTDSATLDNTPALSRIAVDRYSATEAGFLRGSYLQKDDTLAVEAVTPALAKQAARLLAQNFHPRGEYAIALFDLDERNLGTYATQDLDDLYSAVRH